MKAALDTNVLVYAQGVNDAAKRDVATRLVASLGAAHLAVPVQALAELFNVLVRKLNWDPDRARATVLTWHDALPVIETTGTILTGAVDLAAVHRLRIWDAIIMTAAAEGECRLLLSEDLHEGFTWRGVTVVNPFASDRHPLLDLLLN